ncbi:GNAT family N-acetyltransferase [Nocardiopsis sp. CNT-189]|uniref:GNAT family N-acetyltransferase n=1 Tax=Nocardiopsis oceanisediminis TaxID=2816862 RepID=UPI003B372EB2
MTVQGAEVMPVPVERAVAMGDPAVRPMLEGLAEEYTRRYGAEAARRELAAYPETDFDAPYGGVVLIELAGRPVAGGAFRRKDAATAEFKRVWTDSAHRRRGLGRRALSAVEAAAARSGYRRAYLTTGPEQPEAVAMYGRLGYTLSDAEGLDEQGGRRYYAFAKELAGGAAPYDGR